MDSIELIRHMFAASHRQIEAAMKDMTAAQFNWVPTGTANSISAIYIHSLNSEDFFVQALLQGKARLWEENGCAEKTGIMKTPGYSGGWEEFKHMQVDLALFLDYQQAVWAATDAYLEKLDPAELDRKVKFAGGERSVADMLILSAGHTLGHAGEISVLKGVQAG
jgi:hypothetical protein